MIFNCFILCAICVEDAIGHVINDQTRIQQHVIGFIKFIQQEISANQN